MASSFSREEEIDALIVMVTETLIGTMFCSVACDDTGADVRSCKQKLA
jgi:hypothetical protein